MEKAVDKSQLGEISNPTASEREREAAKSSLLGSKEAAKANLEPGKHQ